MLTILVVQPLLLLMRIVGSLVLWPPVAPYVRWIPGLARGHQRGSATPLVIGASMGGVLTWSIEQVCGMIEF